MTWRVRRRGRLVLSVAAMAGLSLAGRAAWPWLVDVVRLHLAERAIVADRLDEAEARLQLLATEHPMRPGPRFLQARVARLRGETTKAEELLQRAVDLGLPIAEARPEHERLRAGRRTSIP